MLQIFGFAYRININKQIVVHFSMCYTATLRITCYAFVLLYSLENWYATRKMVITSTCNHRNSWVLQQ